MLQQQRRCSNSNFTGISSIWNVSNCHRRSSNNNKLAAVEDTVRKGVFIKSVIRCLAKDTIFDYCSPCFAMHVGAFFLIGMSLQFMSHSSPLLYLLWLFSSPREIFWSGADWLLLFVSVLSYFLIFPFSVLFCLDQGKYVVRKVLSAFAAAAAPLL